MSPRPQRAPEVLPRVERGHRRPWRYALLVYAVALTVATHWPALTLGAASPVSDKLVHALAFGALTILLWRTGWFQRRMTVTLVALAWATLDETTQGLPFIRRHVSWPDGIANGLGVVVAAAWLWAAAPVGGAANRARLRVESFAFDQLWTRPETWIRLALAGFVAAGVGVIVPV
ncbi:MAG: hypothetical protein KJO43_04270, partial [Phycisphaerae bacterium]|nr:hypothetical protein [Phycisphaerae bacterium]